MDGGCEWIREGRSELGLLVLTNLEFLLLVDLVTNSFLVQNTQQLRIVTLSVPESVHPGCTGWFPCVLRCHRFSQWCLQRVTGQ